MEGLLSTVPPPAACAPSPAHEVVDGGWAKRELGRFMIPHGLNYVELCKAFLSQVHHHHHQPGLPAPLKTANTKECGVQVNAKVNKIVQCSLGPKTLCCPDGGSPGSDSKSPRSPDRDLCGGGGGRPKPLFSTPPMNNNLLRLMRPVSIYSPVFDRRIFTIRRGNEEGEGGSEGEEADQDEALVENKDVESDECCERTVKDFKTTNHRSAKGSENFQFLEQRYGFFHCKKCNIRWESAYVWCISGTSKVYYKQLCRKCQVGFNPYRVESIMCKGCSQTSCSCERKQRHINMKRPHRQDLCCRCKGMRLSCDVTYSFKYIV